MSSRFIDGQAHVRFWRNALALLAVTTLSAPLAGAAALPDDDLSPLIATIGLPRADEGAALLPVGGWRWRSGITTASHSNQESSGGETLKFDGETTRTSIAFDRAISERLQLGVELPYLWNETGNLDGVIDTWHNWFGLPDGFRDDVAQDQLDFRYQDGNRLLLNKQSNQHGIGDVRLLAGWRLRRTSSSATALRVSLQLPTGNAEKLTGSGTAALSIGIAGDRFASLNRPHWSSFYRAHVVFRGRPDLAAERAKRTIVLLSGGISARASERIELTVQGTLRSAAYDSELRMLGEPALLLNVGGTISLSKTLQLAVSVGEDLRVNSAPDVTLALALHYTPLKRQ